MFWKNLGDSSVFVLFLKEFERILGLVFSFLKEVEKISEAPRVLLVKKFGRNLEDS